MDYSAVLHGTYGASADQIFLEMVSLDYAFVGFQYSHAGSEHNMWFVQSDLLVDHTVRVSWEGMVRWFWLQPGPIAGECLHMKDFCPRLAVGSVVQQLGRTAPSSQFVCCTGKQENVCTGRLWQDGTSLPEAGGSVVQQLGSRHDNLSLL